MEHLDTATEDFHKNSTSQCCFSSGQDFEKPSKKEWIENTLAYRKRRSTKKQVYRETDNAND
jgi:hypothetical protein